MAKKISFVILVIMLAVMLLGGFSSCNSVHKHKSIEQSKSDSSVVKVNDIVIDKKTDNSLDKKTVVVDETVVDVEFEADSCYTTNPVSITAKDGKINIDPGGRKLKSVSATVNNTVDSSIKEISATTDKTTDKSKATTEVKKENEAVDIDKKSSRSKLFPIIAAITASILIFLFFKRKKKEVEDVTT